MREAMAYFLLLNGIRDLRGDSTAHRSMLIHVSRFTDVQNQIHDIANEWLEEMKSDLRNYALLNETEINEIDSLVFLRAVWEKHGLATKASKANNTVAWQHFLSQYLHKAVAPIDVRTVNQMSGVAGLDYSIHKNGLRVIAIGGNSLSRGLTLEGLCVSYFYRKSQMYDTLLQMGRWFGYRPGYQDLFKIWISGAAIDWYGYISSASEELKLEIARMRSVNQTPIEFGLKVRQDPASLIVTARNKMRTGTLVKRPITVSGRLLETPRLKADLESLASNERFFKDFVKRLDDIGTRTHLEDNEHYFWKCVNKDDITQLLREFKTHPWHLSFQGEALAEYIQNKMDGICWDVVIAQGSAKEEYHELRCGDERLRIKPESRTINATKEQISISGTKVRVGTGGAAKVGLSKKEQEWVRKQYIKVNGKKNIPDSAYLGKDLGDEILHRNAILFLHVIFVDRKSTDKKTGMVRSQIDDGVKVPDYLFALGTGFPYNGLTEETASYVVNVVELKNYYDLEEENDE